MAIDRSNRYPGRFDAPTTARPQGAFKNRSAPNAKDGSYLERDWANDWDGFFGSLLRSAGMTPNGTPDTALSSQYFSAMNSVVGSAISLAILNKITGENCRNAGLTAGGTLPYMQRLSDGVVIQLATRQSVIGIDQSWQDMTASRAKNVTYTNSTGRPIQIFIHFDPNGSVFTLGGHPIAVGDNASEFISAIIPNGSTYKLSDWGTFVTTKWLELR